MPTSGGQEDHVSMGMTAALKLRHIVENAEHVIAIELLAAAEALRYRGRFEPGTECDAYAKSSGHWSPVGGGPAALRRYRRTAEAIRAGQLRGVIPESLRLR